MDDTSWVKLYRKTIENGWLQNSKLWTFWCYCLLRASHKEHTQFVGFKQVKLQPGEFVFGRKKVSKELKMSEQSIRTFVQILKSSGNIDVKSTNRFSIVNICNWDIYQGYDISNQPTTNPRPTNNQPTTNHKQEVKNNIYSQEADEIIRYLNQKIGSKYKSTSKNTLESINARMKDGFTVDDFKKVIDNKYSHWFNDDKMRKFLRPETLFAPAHFESYLNEPKEKSKGIGPTGVIL